MNDWHNKQTNVAWSNPHQVQYPDRHVVGHFENSAQAEMQCILAFWLAVRTEWEGQQRIWTRSTVKHSQVPSMAWAKKNLFIFSTSYFQDWCDSVLKSFFLFSDSILLFLYCHKIMSWGWFQFSLKRRKNIISVEVGHSKSTQPVFLKKGSRYFLKRNKIFL